MVFHHLYSEHCAYLTHLWGTGRPTSAGLPGCEIRVVLLLGQLPVKANEFGIPVFEIRVVLLLDIQPFWANELYLPKEPKYIQLAPKPQYGDTPSSSSGDLCICSPNNTINYPFILCMFAILDFCSC